MKFLKYLHLLFLSFIFAGCSNEVEVKGYYVGIEENNSSNIHDLICFDDEKFIDHFPGINEGCSYTKNGNTYSFKCRYEEDFQSRIVSRNDTISWYRLNSDSVRFRYKKSQATSYLLDYPIEKVKINLPEGKGKVKSLGRKYRFKSPLYLYESEGKLMVNCRNVIYSIDDNFFRDIVELRNSNPVSLIADESLTMDDLKQLFTQLKLAGRLRVDYLLEHSVYHEVNFISDIIPPMTNQEFLKYNDLNIPPPPPFREPNIDELKNHALILEISKNGQTTLDQFQSDYKSRLLEGSSAVVLYHVSGNATYKDFIYFLDVTENTLLNLRDEYVMSRYGKNYRDLSDDERDLIIEARAKYPKKMIEIDSAQLVELKKDI